MNIGEPRAAVVAAKLAEDEGGPFGHYFDRAVRAELACAALEMERDATLEEVARLAGERDEARAEMERLTPARIRAAVLAAIDAVHVAPPAWAETVADDVLARLQTPRQAWVVQLEPGVWLAPWGDPGRTPERALAQRFESERSALRALDWARKLAPFLAAVVEVA